MTYLVDTSVLMRLANFSDANYTTARNAIYALHSNGEILHSTPQIYVEFRNSATRPVALNGLGLDPNTVDAHTAGFEAAFPLLLETPEIYPAWKAVVQEAKVIGKQVYDARPAAICHVHRITHVLTFHACPHIQRIALQSLRSLRAGANCRQPARHCAVANRRQ